MEVEFILPDIGEGIVECELLEWLVEEGEFINEDQPVAEVMTDKATVQIPAMHAGTVKSLHYKVGEIAQVHAPLFSLTPTDEVAAKPASNTTSNLNEQEPHSTHIEDFILPDIGEGIVECEIVKWNVNEGDTIAEDQSVVEVMTDKAVVEIPAKHAGVVHKLYYQQGDIAKVHSPLFSLASTATCDQKVPSDNLTNADESTKATKISAQVSVQDTHVNPVRLTSGSQWQDGHYEPPVIIPGRVLASPAVRRLAREHNVDLACIKGSGKKGRVLKQDLLSGNKPTKADREISTQESAEVSVSISTNSRTVKMRGVQAAMAKQMMASVSSIPHFMVSDEVVMDNLMALRAKLKPEFEADGVKLSFMPFFIKAMSLALTKFPIINSQLNEDGTELTYFNDHNIGFAVDAKVGLLVPNIKGVQSLSLFEIAEQMQTIIAQAREGKVSGDALKGGTISISNIGAIGGITATPVINKPEAAIVALGKSQKLPRFNDKGEVEAQHIMMVNWSGDHRIIDGATMVRFNNLWCRYLRTPETMLMHLK